MRCDSNGTSARLRPLSYAIMVFGARGACGPWLLDGHYLYPIDSYKYLGVTITPLLSWSAWAELMASKCKQRTAELVRWARANHVSADIVASVWEIHVESGLKWGLAIASLSPTDESIIDRAQRGAARAILGHSKTSPLPTVLMELGWLPWASQGKLERARLLQRLAQRQNSLIRSVLSTALHLDTPWCALASQALRCICPPGLGTSWSVWQRWTRKWHTSECQEYAQRCWSEAQVHANLRHYHPSWWLLHGTYSINKSVHDKAVDESLARATSRLLCGGQGLRAADPVSSPRATVSNACLACLRWGVRQAETLHHVLHHCPEYDDLRKEPGVPSFLSSVNGRIVLHRDAMTWQQLCLSISFLGKIGIRRNNAGSWSSAAKEAEQLW